jgi:hypothetical protein
VDRGIPGTLGGHRTTDPLLAQATRFVDGQPGVRRITDRLEQITPVLGSDAAVADLLEVSRAQPRRWREGQSPDPEKRDRIMGLDAVRAPLRVPVRETSRPGA